METGTRVPGYRAWFIVVMVVLVVVVKYGGTQVASGSISLITNIRADYGNHLSIVNCQL